MLSANAGKPLWQIISNSICFFLFYSNDVKYYFIKYLCVFHLNLLAIICFILYNNIVQFITCFDLAFKGVRQNRCNHLCISCL